MDKNAGGLVPAGWPNGSQSRLLSACDASLLASRCAGPSKRAISSLMMELCPTRARRRRRSGGLDAEGGSIRHFKRSNLTAQRSWMLADRTLGQLVSASKGLGGE